MAAGVKIIHAPTQLDRRDNEKGGRDDHRDYVYVLLSYISQYLVL